MEFIIGLIIAFVIIGRFPSVRAWIEGGFKGLKDYNNQKDNY